jgi:Na+-driven multidrug efflux pump
MVANKVLYLGIVVAFFATAILLILSEYLPVWLTPDPTLQRMLLDLIPLMGFGQITLVAGQVDKSVGASLRLRGEFV